jgi:phosphoserine phosphatase RsbX
MREAPADATVIDWGVAALTSPGERQSGDLHLVKGVPGGTLVAVVDGLGHGAEAAAAARTAVTTLEEHAAESVIALLQRCHVALKGSRGVVMSLAFLDQRARSLTWAGVGNVEGVVLRGDGRTAARERIGLVARGGIVGSELPLVRPQEVGLVAGDLLFFATDGIREGFHEGFPADASPQHLADHILANHGKGTDDALVLVARYRGATGTSR